MTSTTGSETVASAIFGQKKGDWAVLKRSYRFEKKKIDERCVEECDLRISGLNTTVVNGEMLMIKVKC